jgi:hypothetical protein
LAYHIKNTINGLLLGKSPATSLRVFTSQDHTTPAYVRNTSNWAADHVQQLTCISPWNSDGAFTKAGTLISPRHVIFATHFLPAVNSTIRFIAADNTVVTRTITAFNSIAVTGVNYPDITVGLLDSDVPGTISFARVLPNGWESKLPDIATVRPLAFGTDQEEKLLLMEATQIGDDLVAKTARFAAPPDPAYRIFYENLVSGDSGNPCFFLINGQLVLLTVWTFSDATGTSVSAFKNQVNAAMTSLGGGYQLSEIDLSAF